MNGWQWLQFATAALWAVAALVNVYQLRRTR